MLLWIDIFIFLHLNLSKNEEIFNCPCLMIGIASTSFAANSVASTPVNSEVYSVQKNDTPDVIIVVVDDKGVIIDIIVIKQR